MELKDIITIILAIVGLIISTLLSIGAIYFARQQSKSSFKQAEIASEQLQQSKSTNDDTKRLLEEIKKQVLEIQRISEETKKDIEGHITKIVESHLKQFDPTVKAQQQMAEPMMNMLFSNPEQFVKMTEAFSKLQALQPPK